MTEIEAPNRPSESVSRVRAWIDVGGTFTDCFVVDSEGRRSRGKVLSSGLVKGRVADGSTVDAVSTASLLPFPDGFWDGAEIVLIDERNSAAFRSRVKKYDHAAGRFLLADSLPFSPSPGALFELDSGLEAPVLAIRALLGIGLRQRLPLLDVRLGTTRGTNALLTRRGAKVALITTRGFKDVLAIGTQERPDLFRLDIQKPQPLTDHIIEIDERIDSDGDILESLDPSKVLAVLRELSEKGYHSIAICLLNAYRNDQHERVVESIARQVGFSEISRSTQVANLIKFVSRTETTALDAYLNPVLGTYIQRVWAQLGGNARVDLRLMTSGGHLVRGDEFRGCDSVLSGPAGGVIALAEIGNAYCREFEGSVGVIGFDMGGTSTDVSRYEGELLRQFETRKAGVRIMAPVIAIHTVAAGGGSVCKVEEGRLLVGPDSAGSQPGPACYGSGGPLTVTDLNLILGRVVESHFPFRLDRQAACDHLLAYQQELAGKGIRFSTIEALAEGFWRIAVNHMAEAVRTVTLGEGADARKFALVSFGGAAGQHACAVASALGMTTIIDHPDSSVMSALGMGLSAIGRAVSRGVYEQADTFSDQKLRTLIHELVKEARQAIAGDAPDDQKALSPIQNAPGLKFALTVEMRYVGTDVPLAVQSKLREDNVQFLVPSVASQIEQFHAMHFRSFGYDRRDRIVEVQTVRVDVEYPSQETIQLGKPVVNRSRQPDSVVRLFIADRWIDAGQYDRDALVAGDTIDGPALIFGPHSTLVVEPGWQTLVCNDGSLVTNWIDRPQLESRSCSVNLGEVSAAEEAIELEVLSRRLEAIAQQMGEVLRRTAISVNVKERLDYSCAVFNEKGYLIAGAMHVPVHLGAMGHTVRNIIQRYPKMFDGDCYVSNNPYAGGSHLPDVTVVSPVFVEAQGSEPDFYVASRAHHAEIGGLTPGSMPPHARILEEEGVVIDGFALVRNGQSYTDELESLLRNARYPSRNPRENIADIAAQIAAGRRGAADLRALAAQIGTGTLQRRMMRLFDLSADSIADAIRLIGNEVRQFQDELTDGYKISVELRAKNDLLTVNFAGTSSIHPGGWNATPAIVTAALLYVLRCLTRRPLPLCEGILQRIELIIPEGLLNPKAAELVGQSPAVVAGNVETSQRIVDCLLGSLGIAGASQGTMNNLLVGDNRFGYYETICGGAGAVEGACGASAVHTHMTNTRITDPEILETRYPMRLRRFAIRTGSGGNGRFRGGDGIVREIEFLRPLTVSMLSSRRGENVPYGIAGGSAGVAGRNCRVLRSGEESELPASFSMTFEAGETLRIETPGGGGFGSFGS